MAYEYSFSDPIGTCATFGLVVLMSDETLEHDMRRMLPIEDVALYTTRIYCDTEVSGDTLGEMAKRLPESVSLFPLEMPFDCVAYGCTSGTSVIGTQAVAELIEGACATKSVTEPISALVAACEYLEISNLAFLSPYVRDVSTRLMGVLNTRGIRTPYFGSFDESDDRRVARIDPQSIFDAAVSLAEDSACDGLFLSCTNLRTLDIIPRLEDRLGIPVLSSNQVMGWHMARQAGLPLAPGFGRLLDD